MTTTSPVNGSSSPTLSNIPPCHQCGQTVAKILRCSRCHFAHYCNAVCQKLAWPDHKKTCKLPLADEKKAAEDKQKCWEKVQAVEWHGNKKLHHPAFPYEDRIKLWAAFAEEVTALIIPATLQRFCKTTPKEQQVGKFALELGCGRGDLSIYLLKQGWHVAAFDNSEGALVPFKASAKKWIEEKKLTIHHDDVTKCNFPKNTQLILANDILPYCNPKDLKMLLQKIYDSLNKNGHFIGNFFLKAKSPELQEAKLAMGSWAIDSEETVRSVLLAMGFEIVLLQHRQGESGEEFIVKKK